VFARPMPPTPTIPNTILLLGAKRPRTREGTTLKTAAPVAAPL